MKFTLIYAIVLIALLVNEVSSKPRKAHLVNEVSKPRKAHLVNEVSSKPRKHKKKEIGFCKNKTLSDGTQNEKGSCSTTIQGDIPSVEKMTSTLIVSPNDGAVLDPHKAFSVDVVVDNLETGEFSDPEKSYYTKPQELNGDGIVKGHTHITIQKLKGKRPPDPKKFAFFEGLNDKADGKGLLSADVVDENGKSGLPPGHYRICTMASSFTHQPLLMPVAKRGSQDDCIRIKVKGH